MIRAAYDLHSVFTEGRVGDSEGCLILAKVLERRVCLLILLVVEHSMALREGSTLDILSGNTNVMTFHAETSKCQRFRGSHVDVLAVHDSLGAASQNTFQVLVDVKVVWCSANLLCDVLQLGLLDGSWQMR